MSFRAPIILAAAGVLALAACSPTTEDNRRTRAGLGAGALLGGALGAMVAGDDNRLAGAVVGAAAGSIVGAAIGDRLDRQAAELRRDLGEDVQIRNTGAELVVTMPQDLLFAVDSAVVRPDLQADLRTLATNLNRYDDSRIRVVGHTDNTGSASYNQGLSERRANAVAAVLRNAGVSGARITAIGRGEERPIATNLTPEGRAQNRRVEIVITPEA